jgi:hypothetical protein
MSQRGRGCLEVKPSANPFFQTASSEHGVDSSQKVEWTGHVDPAMTRSSEHAASENFSFLYTRESDRIGAKVPKNAMPVRRPLTKTEFLKQRREKLMETCNSSSSEFEELSIARKSIPAGLLLENWNQGSKCEDPRFTTSSNVYGSKAPTAATFVSERASRPQGFSNSFSNAKAKNTSLNTGLTKSNVHPSLDPQFT